MRHANFSTARRIRIEHVFEQDTCSLLSMTRIQSTGRMLARFAALCMVVAIAACSTLGVPSQPARAIDPLRDDLSSVIVAFDLPRGLGPAKGSLLTFDVANGGSAEHLRLMLEQADVDELPTTLPPPAADRAYYLFALTPGDRAMLRAGQDSALQRGAPSTSATLAVIPKLCTAGPVDATTATVSVFAVLPGKPPLPFLNRQVLSVLLQQPGSTQMGPCS